MACQLELSPHPKLIASFNQEKEMVVNRKVAPLCRDQQSTGD